MDCSQGIIGGDSNLSARGEEYARHLPDVLIDRLPLVRGAVQGGTSVHAERWSKYMSNMMYTSLADV